MGDALETSWPRSGGHQVSSRIGHHARSLTHPIMRHTLRPTPADSAKSDGYLYCNCQFLVMRGTCLGRRISLAALSGRLGAFLAAKTRRRESDGPATHARVANNGSALGQWKRISMAVVRTLILWVRGPFVATLAVRLEEFEIRV